MAPPGKFGWEPDAYEIAKCHDLFSVQPVKNVLGARYSEGLDRRMSWEIEQEHLERVLESWDQGDIGSCVGNGASRCVQDMILYEMAQDGKDFFPGFLPAEVTYGGSRVEIGGGRINGDGSLGIWAAQYMKKYGILPRADYGQNQYRNLSRYSVTNCRWWGDHGVPDDLEPLTKKHGIADFAQTQSFDDCLSAWEQGSIGTYCGMEAYETRRGADGICRRNPRDQWPHCQYWRGIIWLKSVGPVLVVQNSWGDYLDSGNNRVTLESGRELILPAGAYCVVPDDVNRQFRSGDSHVYKNVSEWEISKPKWLTGWALRINSDLGTEMALVA